MRSRGMAAPPKRPKRRLPGIESRWFPRREAWLWRARFMLGGKQFALAWRDSQEAAYADYQAAKTDAPLAATNLTVSQACRLAIAQARDRGAQEISVKTHYKSRTIYIGGILGDPLVSELRVADLNRYIREARQAGRQDVTIKGDLQLLGRLMVLSGLSDITKAKGVLKLKPSTAKREVLSAAETAEILHRIRTETIYRWASRRKDRKIVEPCPGREHDADLLELLAVTGLRSAELARVTVLDCDTEKGEILVREPKDRSNPRRVLIPDRELIRRCIERVGEGPLVSSMDYISGICRKWRDRLGLPALNARMLRRGFASEAVADGLPLSTVATLMGHKHVTTTDRYVHDVTTRRQQERLASRLGARLRKPPPRGRRGRKQD